MRNNLPQKIKEFSLKNIPCDPVHYQTIFNLAKKYFGNTWNNAAEEKDPLTPEERILVDDFKTSLKKHLYFISQGRYCCFCGIELQLHDATKDLEHLISKSGKVNNVFELKNIAISCKDCNIPKGKLKVTIDSINEESDPIGLYSGDYIIVHPHYDEWQEHFYIDNFGRVSPINPSIDSKAFNTINICNIHKKNAMRLADHFSWLKDETKTFEDWVEFYSLVNRELGDSEYDRKNEKKMTALTDFAHSLADALNSSIDAGKDTIEFALGELLQKASLQEP